MAKPTNPPADPTVVPAPVPTWRTVALCHTACNIYFGGQPVHVLGGQWVTEPDRVATIRGCEQFRFIDVTSAEHLAEVQAKAVETISRATRELAELGYLVVPHGTPQGFLVAPHRTK